MTIIIKCVYNKMIVQDVTVTKDEKCRNGIDNTSYETKSVIQMG